MTDRQPIAREPAAVAEGDPAPELTVGPITRTHIVRYAGAGGDFNPIHHDEEFARSAGMPTIFAMGLMHGGMLAANLARWLGRANVLSYRLRFTGQVWPGDTLTFSGRVDRVYEDVGERRAECSLRVTRQTGDDVIRATAVARVA